MSFPSSVTTEWVRGQFLVGFTDGPDPDQDPDAVPAQGTVVFVPSVPYLPVPTASPNPLTVLPEPRVAVLDSEGYVSTPTQGTLEPAYRGMRLETNNDPDVSVQDWTWTATYKFTNSTKTVPTHSFVLNAGVPVDLTTVVKVPSSTGIGTEQAEALAASAQAAAVASAADAALAASAAEAAAGAAQVTDSNIATLIGNPTTETAAEVEVLVAAAASGKLDADDAVITYQTLDGLDANAAAKANTEGTSLNAAVKAIADTSAGSKIPASEKGAANGVATLDSNGQVPLSALAALFAGYVIAAEPSGGDDTATLNALLVSGAGKTVLLKAGRTYKTSDMLTVPTGTEFHLNGATLDAAGIPAGTSLGQRIAVQSAGSLGASIAVSAAITQWSRTVTGIASTAGLATGDLILLRNEDPPVPGMTRVDRDRGELNIVQSVDSSTQITLTTGAVLSYSTNGLVIQKVTPVENVTIRGGRILMGGVGSAHNGVKVQYGKNVTVRDMIVKGAEDVAIGLYTVWGGKVRDSTVRDSTSHATLGNTGYGVLVADGSRHVTVKDNTFHNCRHFVAGGGKWPAVFVDVEGNHGEKASDAGYDVHEPCIYWTFRGNTAAGVSGGFIIRGQYITVEDNDVADSTGYAYKAATFDGATEQRGIRFVNNRWVRSGFGMTVDGQAAGAEPNCLKINVEVRGNKGLDGGANPVLVRHFDGCVADGNVIEGATSHALLFLGLSGTQSKNLAVGGGLVRNAAGDGVKAQYVDGVKITGTQIIAPTLHGVELLNCTRTSQSGVTVSAPGQSGVFINAGAGHAITGADITGGTNATYDAVRVTGSSDVSINGGILASARWAVYTTTTDNVVLTGAHLRGAFNAGRHSIDATNKVVANNLL